GAAAPSRSRTYAYELRKLGHARLSSDRLLHKSYRRPRVGHLDDEPGVPLVMQLDDDGLGGIADVPEDVLAVDVERAGRDHARHVRAGRADALGLLHYTRSAVAPRTLLSGTSRRLLSAQSLSIPSISTTSVAPSMRTCAIKAP